MSLNTLKTINKKSQHGVGLLEVMIVVLVAAVGLLGIAKLQLFNNQTTMTAYLNAQAVEHLEEMIERLRSNRKAAIKGDYNLGLSSLSDLPTLSQSAPQAKKGVHNWIENLSISIPNAKAAIRCEGSGLCVLAVHYTGTQALQKQALVVQL